jgi:hypothetical protein
VGDAGAGQLGGAVRPRRDRIITDPLGGYDVSRFDGDWDAMITQVMAFYKPDGFGEATT